MNEKGFTLLETLVVMAVIATLLIITVPWTLNYMRRARSEAEIRTLYANLTEARQRTIERNFPYIVSVTSSAVDVYEDRNGNNTADTAEKVNGLSLTIGPQDYPLTGTVGATTIGGTAAPFTINIRGVVLSSATMYLTGYNTDPGVTNAQRNCIRIDSTRINQGKYNALSTDANKCERQ
jgi:prepilin-type N-terminal cleavage/methylation domain-containing protein